LSVPDDVVHLREHRMFAVDHGIGSGALLGKMDHCLGFEALDDRGEKVVLHHIADKEFNGLARKLLPNSGDPKAGGSASGSARQVRGPIAGAQSCRQSRPNVPSWTDISGCPTAVAIASQHRNPHVASSPSVPWKMIIAGKIFVPYSTE
jgi:hypothetical protein